MALEFEIHRWKSFRDGLFSQEEKVAFDDLMDMCRMLGMEASNACNPVVFEPMVMSILLMQQKRIKTLQRKIDALLISNLKIEKPNATTATMQP